MNAAIAKAGGLGVAVALATVLIVYLAADAASGPLLVTQPGSDTPEEVPIGAALGFTILGGVIGTGLALGINRLRRPRNTFVAACVVALVLYGVMPFTAAEEISTALWLNVLHVAAAVPIIGLLAHALPAERSTAARAETETVRSTA